MIRVLLVDDDRVDREICEYYLKKLGDDLEITTCGDSLLALEKVNNENFDCIISDVQMPGMNGLELLSKIRENSDSTPFIILSGQNDKEVAVEAFSADADDYFPKDSGFILYERLVHSIRKVVKAHTEHKKILILKEETERAREKLQSIKKRAMLGSWEYDFTEKRLSCCKHSLELLGLNEEEFDGTSESLSKNFHNEDKPLIEKVATDLENGAENFSCRHKIKLANGQVRVVEANGTVIKTNDGVPQRIIGTNQDVTSLYRLEKALNESYVKFKESFSRAAVGMVLVDMDSNIVEANKKFCDMFSFQVGDLINKPISDFENSEDAPDFPGFRKKIKLMLKGELSSFSEQSVFHLGDGREVNCRISSSVIKDENGVPRNLLTQFIPH